MSENTIFETLKTLGLPVVYGRHTQKVKTPYLLLTGAGQDAFEADNTYYVRKDRWTIEYYFTEKNPDLEARIEDLLLSIGRRYEKSEDIYLDDQEVFWLYYDV